MDIERLKELADCDVFIGGNPIVADRAQETLRTLIDEAIETETTGCRYCRGIESHGIVAVKTVIDEYLRVISACDTPYNYCPNCGRKIKEDWYGGTVGVACHDMGFDAVGFELDEDYYKASSERLENHQKQISLFDYLNNAN